MASRKVTYYRKDPAGLLEDLQNLFETRGESRESNLVLHMVDTVLKLVRDSASHGDLKMIRHALLELRYAFKVFAPYRDVRKVSVFGSARTAEDQPSYGQAAEFANLVTRLGFMVITGAGSGIMEAAQGGAGREKSFGVNIRLPFEQKANDVIHNDPKLIHFKYFFTRKVVFVKETDAIAIFPGGFGTHDEAFESLTLVQTGKSDLLPLVLVDPPGGSYWKDWLAYIEKHLKGSGYIDPNDIDLFHVTDDVNEAVENIRKFYSNYESMSFVRSRLILRFKQPITDEQLEHVNSEFADILVRDTIARHDGPLPGERDEEDGLHRLGLAFDRQSYGRLRKMVDYLNGAD